MRRWRPRTQKFHEEQVWLRRWLHLIEVTLARDSAAARELIATAKLVRGYGDTYKRGLTNWDRIASTLVEPTLSGAHLPADLADQILQARIAAEKDPEGSALTATLSAISSHSPILQAAQ